ncbi:MAG: prephenate dehydrogenase [Armatimonadetes bacterium]|nr:prephenate dehydrogenase [Armatimonadota bacterium]
MLPHVAIIGVGLMGGSLGMALRQRGLASRVTGVGRRAERLETARSLGAVDAWALDPHEGVREADIVFIGVPVGQTAAIFRQVAPSLPGGCLVTDLGSAKARLTTDCEAACPEGVFFVGGHPMAGSEATGVEAARPDLYEGAVYILTETARTDPGALERLEALVRALGAAPLRLAPEDHDRMVAFTSHLPHLLAWALARAAEDARRIDPSLLSLAAGSFRDMTRIAASSPEMWRDIFLHNRENLLKAALDFRLRLQALEDAITSGDEAGLERLLAEGQTARKAFRG